MTSLKFQFLHDCCDEIIEGKEVNVRNYNNDIEWTAEDVVKTKTMIKEYFCKSIINHDSTTEKLEFPSETISNSIRNCLNTRKQELEHHLIKTAFLEAEHNLVESFDWNLKWVLGNSMMPNNREPIIQLKLQCARKNMDSKVKHNIDFEMNTVQVDHLISDLENILKKLS